MVAGVEPRVTASANPIVAKRHGLTKWDRARGQYVAPDPQMEEPVTGYDAWTVALLKAELDNRREAYLAGEDEEGAEAVSYTNSDKKADLVVLLTEDDEAQLPPEED